MLNLFDRHAHDLIPYIQTLPYRPGGILPSELLAMLCVIKDRQVNWMLESGRHYAYSTFGLCGNSVFTTSIDNNPIPEVDAELSKLHSHYTLDMKVGDGPRVIQATLDQYDPDAEDADRIGMFLDGPKGIPALKLIQRNKAKLVFGCVHDMSKMQHGDEPNPGRAAAETSGMPTYFTDDPEFIAQFGFLDDIVVAPGYRDRAHLTEHGFTLAIFQGAQWDA